MLGGDEVFGVGRCCVGGDEVFGVGRCCVGGDEVFGVGRCCGQHGRLRCSFAPLPPLLVELQKKTLLF